jgi:hypothetical protein
MDEIAPTYSALKKTAAPEPLNNEDSEEIVPEQYYYVLQTGKISGPFTIKRLVEMALSRTVSRGDFVQVAGSSDWQLLPVALDPSVPPPEGTSPAPEFKTIASWSWLRLRYNLDEKSLLAGCVCLGISVLGVLFSRWTVIFWGPLILPPLVAGVALVRKRRIFAGVLLLLAVLMVPILARKLAAL